MDYSTPINSKYPLIIAELSGGLKWIVLNVSNRLLGNALNYLHLLLLLFVYEHIIANDFPNGIAYYSPNGNYVNP